VDETVPTTPEEADRIAQEIHDLAAGFSGLTAEQRTDALLGWTGPITELAGATRLFQAAAIAPTLAAGHVRALTRVKLGAGLWGLDPSEAGNPDPVAVAVGRALTYALNDDPEATSDVIDAHVAVHGAHGDTGLVQLGVAALVMLGELIAERGRRRWLGGPGPVSGG
jgi:hypothetical protein